MFTRQVQICTYFQLFFCRTDTAAQCQPGKKTTENTILSLCYNPGMSDSPITKLACTQCGGELHPDEGQIFLTCPYCGATVYLDASKVVFHWILAPTLDPQQAAGALSRWMSGSQTVKDLDKKARVSDQTFQYFPLWYFVIAENNHELAALEVAAATSVTEIARLELPAGDLRPYDASIDPQSAAPSVPLETAQSWLAAKHPANQIRQSSLVHIPVYFFHYVFKNQTYSAVVEAATGVVLANIYPAKAEAPYLTAGCVTAFVYIALALLALSGVNSFGGQLNLGLALLLALIAAPFLFFFAVFIASRV
jgi:hypothetical protein